MQSSRHAISAYRRVDAEARVAAASPHRLIALLYEGALNALAHARGHMQRGNVAAKGEAIGKAIAILQEGLIPGLNRDAGGSLSQQLHDLYQYMTHRLLLANLNDDAAALDEVKGLLNDLKGAWDAIGGPAAGRA
ncbi:MAG: flagellar export chaperone FliS [Betaproteobacteria bacterium]|nr:flagellar export chaperone FliS [Betaproteobacteria bacterium]